MAVSRHKAVPRTKADPNAIPIATAAKDLGAFLRVAFAESSEQALPDIFEQLLARLGAGEAPPPPRPEALPDNEFKVQLAAVIPHLRAFGRSLSGSRDLADDLVQETLLKAWAARDRFQAGTNMRAWTFIILRNLFLSQMRRSRFKGEWDDFTADKLLAMPAGQDRQIDLADLQRGLLQLPQAQREALILVGAGGFAYEEAASICDCAVGTIKSRVARGRAALEIILNEGLLPSRRTDAPTHGVSALNQIMGQVDTLARG
ncbi:sigma-70 family RNA polymerase sigma factor [Glacieibacterium sp.]|uniref:sigma-70 family RNA polymerase sigma factor n=1 Tax=Glacieibacterium sp. TaxID=2860237 RepID=UPI003AFF7275